jgi:transposase-like protein
MHGRERRVLLRHYLEQGLSKTEVARSLGVSRRTLYHWMHGGQLDRDLDNAPVRYRPRPPVARKIDRYAYPGASGLRCWSCSGIRGSCGCSITLVRRLRS